MLQAVYKAMMQVSTPFLEAYLKKRAARGREDVARADERRGTASRARPAMPLVWCHAASVGESLALLSVVERLLQDNKNIAVLVTTGTVTSAKLMAERLPEGAFHQYMPVDHPRWTARFLDHWRPDFAVWSESEFWPNILAGLRRRRIPAVLLNARMSQKTFSRWQWARGMIGGILSGFDLCLGQNAAEAARLEKLGAPRTQVSANLKYAARPLPCDDEKLSALRAATGKRPMVLWASTHPGEEEIAGRVHKELCAKTENLLTVIVPRHPARGAEVQALLEKQGLRALLRSDGQSAPEAAPEIARDVYIADTLGELGLFFRLCPLVVMGGSFADIGGHNPIEPAQLGAAVFYGPRMYNFVTINDDFLSAKAACQVADVPGLVAALLPALENPDSVKPMAEAARWLTQDKSQIVDDLAALLNPYVEKAVKAYHEKQQAKNRKGAA
jgi:3-deoxy-D-manno-octulosonic-acid transferase